MKVTTLGIDLAKSIFRVVINIGNVRGISMLGTFPMFMTPPTPLFARRTRFC
jgi:hypothetical protein